MPKDALRATPAVVFVDDGPWECFFQLAAVLRKAKIRTIRITAGSSGSRAECLLFDRNVSLTFPPSPEQLAEILCSEYVLDVQPSDSLAVATYAALELISPANRSNIWEGRSSLLDKWSVANTLRDHALLTPETLLVEVHSPVDAVAKLSLPIVLKRRIGSAGTGVKVFDSLESLEEFVKNVETPSDWFFERFIHGRSLVCASYVGVDGIDVITTYEILKRTDPFGPSIMVEIKNDAKLTENGKVLVDALRIRGLLCFDIIRDSNDADWIHDVNVRVFGAFSLCQLAGIDFIGAYIGGLSGRSKVRTQEHDSLGVQAFVFPFGLRELYQSRRPGIPWIRTLSWIWNYSRLLGLRYLLSLVLRAFMLLLKRERRRLGSR
jgi:hypothetical protein